MVERFSLDRESGGPPVHHEEEISLLTYVCIYHTSLLHRHHHSPHLTPPQAPSLTTPHSSTGTITHHTSLPPHAPSLTTPHSSTSTITHHTSLLHTSLPPQAPSLTILHSSTSHSLHTSLPSHSHWCIFCFQQDRGCRVKSDLRRERLEGHHTKYIEAYVHYNEADSCNEEAPGRREKDGP